MAPTKKQKVNSVLLQFFNLTKIPMMHLLLWFLPKFDQCHLLKQTWAGASSKWIQILNQNVANLQSNWCALVDYQPSFILFLNCLRSMCCQKMKKVSLNWRSWRRTIIFPTNVKRFGVHNSHGLRCWRVNMDKYIKWNTLYAHLWKVRILFWGQILIYLKNMQEKRRQFVTCHIWAKRQMNYTSTTNVVMQKMR